MFVSADENSPAAAGVHADLNAAANIGLRALMDPDFTGKWWYVPSDAKTKMPRLEKVKGGIVENLGPLVAASSLVEGVVKKGKRATVGKPRDIVNLWRDPCSRVAVPSGGEANWKETSEYWDDVQARVVMVLGKRWNAGPTPDDIPF